MANPLGARKSGSFKAVSTAPSINKTPVGAATPPLPYPVSQDLSASTGTVNSVRFNGEPAYVLDQTTQPRCTGDEAGSAGGVKSGTVNGEVKPAGASSSVHVGGRRVVREGDPCTLNNGNCPGIYLTTPAPDTTEKPTPETVNPPVRLETEAEKSYYQQAREALAKAREAAKPGAEYYQKNIAGPLHDFAGDAMDKGMKATALGEGTMLAGGAVAATGVGAPVAAGMEVIGGAATAVGAGVTTVGGVTETGATVLDAAADFVLTGELPDMTALALAFAENMLAKKINKLKGMVPGKKGTVKKDIHHGDTQPQTETGAGGGKKGKDGFKVLGSKTREKGKCGEWLAGTDMAEQGFDEVVAVQNNSGHGVDLIGRNSTTGEVKVWEVKTTDGNSAPSLSRDQSKLGGEKFTQNRLQRAVEGQGNYGKVPEARKNAKKVKKWLEQANKRNANTTYEKYEVFVDDLDKGCFKHPNRPSRSRPWVPKVPKAKL